MRQIRTLLIANRGEIAIRIARTCAKMGIASVAVFSDADQDALFVRHADQAVRIGPAPSRDSYLRIDRILEAARVSGADAVHPGFGFLAENADFAQAVRDAGLVFIGPSPAAIRAMGLKREAKIAAEAAGVPVISGYAGDDASEATFAARAREIGYPILLKASAGGGGKGMRIVRAEDELAPAMASARREAQSAFGNPALLLEKYIERPRHVEIQVLGDEHGRVVHLFERECSIQRRHQKLIEEAPCPVLSPELRERMGADAVRLCASIGYSSAGTVEFVLDAAGAHHFLEVNTRLQVEHPVTEGVILGLDLVEEQIRIARGEPLRFTQDDLRARWRGAAIECRLCAEDPANDFLPQSGRIADFHVPAVLLEQDWLRIETGVESGSDVPVHYDSMIAKIVTRGDTRADAITRMRGALSALSVQGIATNRAFLLRVIEHADFLGGELDTSFIETRMPDALADVPDANAAQRAAIAATLWSHWARASARVVPSLPISGFRNNRFAPQVAEYRVGTNGQVHVAYVDRGGDLFDVEVSQANATERLSGSVRRVSVGAAEIVLELPTGRVIALRVIADGDTMFVHEASSGASFALATQPRFADRDADAAVDGCVAPMPGKVLQVLVAIGERVAAGTPIVLLEAMKMEHAVRAPHAGVVTELRASVGEQVQGGALLAVVDGSGEA